MKEALLPPFEAFLARIALEGHLSIVLFREEGVSKSVLGRTEAKPRSNVARGEIRTVFSCRVRWLNLPKLLTHPGNVQTSLLLAVFAPPLPDASLAATEAPRPLPAVEVEVEATGGETSLESIEEVGRLLEVLWMVSTARRRS